VKKNLQKEKSPFKKIQAAFAKKTKANILIGKKKRGIL
jgi:hypothetical protein